jgi:glycosyltransferase involved in cell wall biosynthesis
VPLPQPLHIAMDVRRARSYGIGTYIRNITRALSRIDQVNRYTLVAHPNDFEVLSGLGPRFQFAPHAVADRGLRHNLTTPGVLRRLNADLYHIPLNSVPWRMPRPYVMTLHDMSSLMFPQKKDFRYMLHEARFRRGVERAAHIMSVSNATRRDILDVIPVPESRISTIYSAPDPLFTVEGNGGAADQAILDRYSITFPYVLYAGTIRPRKNIPRLVEAFAVLRHEMEQHPRYRDLRLVIIGDDLSRNMTVRRAVAQSRIEPHVRFLGFVPIETLRVFYRRAALFAFPSLYEGFGLAPLEAMACGCPVVASNVPSLVEAVGDAAELVHPENVFDIARGMLDVLMSDERRSELVRMGRAQAEHFSWDASAHQVLAIYQKCAREPRK